MSHGHEPAQVPGPGRWLRRSRALTIAGVTAVVATTATVLPIAAGDDGLTLHPVADTTITPVARDGDNNGKTTLASCPSMCDGNPNGRRDATLQFAVEKLPANAVDVKATLRVYAWHDFAARILARTVPGDLNAATPARIAGVSSVQTIARVSKGFNEFDVSATIRRNGTYTVALSQEDLHTRVYWASRENPRDDLRPELVLSYRTATTTEPPSAPERWRLVWGDEFDGGSLDRSKWNLRNGEGRDIDRGCNVDSPKNTFVGNGTVTLRALRESVRCGSQNRQYSQSYLDTIGRFSWTYGRFEMRARSPNRPGPASRGLWPAFWLRPDDGGNGEIDIAELPGGDGWHDRSTAAIFYDYSPVKQDARFALPGGAHPGDGFHTYATEWDSQSLTWYIDGELVWTRDRSTTPWFDEAFHKPYNIRLNFQVGGWLGDPDGNTRFPADFVVDHVRVYQHQAPPADRAPRR